MDIGRWLLQRLLNFHLDLVGHLVPDVRRDVLVERSELGLVCVDVNCFNRATWHERTLSKSGLLILGCGFILTESLVLVVLCCWVGELLGLHGFIVTCNWHCTITNGGMFLGNDFWKTSP